MWIDLMSRAFTKEDPWEEPIIPPRPPLPDGVPNYVTPRGLTLLRDEQARLEAERIRLEDVEDDAARKMRVVLARRLADLAGRIATAEVIDPARQAHDSVRFGARVTLRDARGATRVFQIVGVDESDPDNGLVAFTAPIARAVIGCGVGDTATLRAASGDEKLTIVEIDYPIPA
jgi:transcription elongation factor GreB